jgi:hypothetical protein
VRVVPYCVLRCGAADVVLFLSSRVRRTVRGKKKRIGRPS